MNKVRSKGVMFFGLTMIVGAVFQMFALNSGGLDWYRYLHQEYESQMIMFRYAVSWAIKLVGLILGWGILELNDLSRKLLILYYIFIISTIHLKHAYPAYHLHTMALDRAYSGIPHGFTFESITWPALIIQRLIDVIFGLFVIYFFTRKDVINQFKTK